MYQYVIDTVNEEKEKRKELQYKVNRTMTNQILQISIVATVLLLGSATTIFSIEKIEAKQQKDDKDNSLVACVDYFLKKHRDFKANLTQQELEAKLDVNPYFNDENNVYFVAIPFCEFTKEHEGVYGHLLPLELQEKYGMIVAAKIIASDLFNKFEKEETQTTYNVDDIIKESVNDPNLPSNVRDMKNEIYRQQLERQQQQN
jgi:hypothetical protein